MIERLTGRVIRAAVMLPLLAALALTPMTLLAAPAPSSASIEAKKAEEAAAKLELENMRDALSAKVTEYVRLSQQVAATREEIAEVGAEIIETDADLIRTRQAVTDRAVELYRSDRQGLLELLLDAESIPDLLLRLKYVSSINAHDSALIKEMRITRYESEWLHQSLSDRERRLIELQDKADESRVQIEADIQAQEAKAAEIGADVAEMMRQAAAAAEAIQLAGGDPVGDFDPDTIISDTAYRASTSMSVEQIQSFLNEQPGTLARYSAPDHNGQVKSVAEMIAEASVAWGVSPKVVMSTLQKEQSLLSRTSPSQTAYDWAMGCGKADTRTFYEFQGFGNQIWHGTRKLAENAEPWKPGIEMNIDGSTVRPTNSSTYSLYKYTPHLHGTMSFWLIYWRYFGDPQAL